VALPDGAGRVFLAVANPAPFPGTPEFPNGSSRPGPNLYTNSLVALDGQTGNLLWYRQEVAHDIRDPAFVTSLGTGTGAVAAVDPGTGQVLWRRDLPKIDLGGTTVSNDVVSPVRTTARSTPSTSMTAPCSGRPRHEPASTRSRPSPGT
jgi:glucose dehydrogenase